MVGTASSVCTTHNALPCLLHNAELQATQSRLH